MPNSQMPNSDSRTPGPNAFDPNRAPTDDTPSTRRSDNPLPFILPFILFMVIASRYPDFAGSYDENIVPQVTVETWQYIIMIGVQVLVAAGLLGYFRKTYLQHFPFRVSPLSIGVGIVGIVLWIALCELGLELKLFVMLGFDVSRPAFNPFTIPDQSVRWLFFISRFSLLAIVVPIVEELFVRGWFARWFHDPSWENIKLTGLPMKTLLAVSLYGVLTHPGEAIAAFVWFGLVSWLMNRTGNLWDCVVAHAVTNFLLGIYVVWFSQWQLW